MNNSSQYKHRGLGRWFAYLHRRAPGDRFVFGLITIILFISVSFALYSYNKNWLTNTPGEGGILVEGMVGAPRFINPVLAITKVDTDLHSLLYSGLVKISAEGELVNDLAESITVSDDGTVYNVVIREDANFSDNSPVRASDVAYTISQIQNQDLKSPLRGSWNEVKVEVLGDKELNFVLTDAFNPFMENLVIGILPQGIWGELSAESFPFSTRNTEPIGSGPYKIKTVSRAADGLIESYTLVPNEFALSQPMISGIKVVFFENESSLIDALNLGSVDATASLSRDEIEQVTRNDFKTNYYPLPRVFSVFMNQNKSTVLRDAAVRKALNAAVDRNKLVADVLKGAGQPTALPVPTGFHTLQSTTSLDELKDYATEAKAILSKGGWKDNGSGGWQKVIDKETVTLSLKLATANAAYFDNTAQYLKESWKAAGIDVEIALFEQADLMQTVIRPRDYELLLFGTDMGRSLDLYPYWHSSHREDPGLNISVYTNLASDAELDDYRTATDDTEQTRALTNFLEIVVNEVPAVFLYNPSAIYIYKSGINIIPTERVARMSDRFSTITDWYIQTEALWPLFIKN